MAATRATAVVMADPQPAVPPRELLRPDFWSQVSFWPGTKGMNKLTKFLFKGSAHPEDLANDPFPCLSFHSVSEGHQGYSLTLWQGHMGDSTSLPPWSWVWSSSKWCVSQLEKTFKNGLGFIMLPCLTVELVLLHVGEAPSSWVRCVAVTDMQAVKDML